MAAAAIAIDAMSGDFGPRVTVPSAVHFLEQNPENSIFLIGDEAQIAPLIPSKLSSRITLIHTAEVVEMDEQPMAALRGKKQSSMRLAVNLVAEGNASACVSAGNTGALMAISRYVLKMLDGVSRPAICGALPSLRHHSYLLDMGANVDCDAQNLLQFAVMADEMVRAVDGRENPKTCLLNNGEESNKGNSQVREADELLSAESGINYIGFVEGHQLYDSPADIIVCDGFVGNIALKSAEGVATYILEKIKQEIHNDPITKLLAFFAKAGIGRIKSRIDPRKYNGATLLGLNGVVVKSHGHADEEAFYHAVEHARHIADANLIAKLSKKFNV